MTTSRTISLAVAVSALALVSTSAKPDIALSTPEAALAPALSSRDEQAVFPTAQPTPTRRYAYAWPVKPFRVQHPIRGFFGDPRISNHGRTRQFHFGVDISAPNGTAVYATLTGTAYIHPLHATTVAVVGRDGLEFSYWHVVPTVRNGQHVVAYETVIGRIEEPYGHVHFSEKRAGRYLNPLRPGALGPYADHTTPEVRSIAVRDGLLVAEAYDETPLAVPRPWHDLPVMPALVRWRLLDTSGRPVSSWQVAVDFRLTIPPASQFDRIWAPGVTQNHVRAAGRYRLALDRFVDERTLDGRIVEVAVVDSSGNASRSRFPALDLLSRS
jgi:hypothetical protein